MNRSSDREMRLTVLEAQIRDVAERQKTIAARADRMEERLDLLTSVVLKLNRELGAQRTKYPLD